MKELFLIACLCVSVAILIRAFLSAKGTTLRAPIVWSLVSVSVLLLTEVFMRPAQRSDLLLMRYLTGTSTLCPAMALLGAKRPQDRGWQFIVASLWGILVIPTVQPLVFAKNATLELHGAWSGFLVVLIVVGGANFWATRYAVPATLAFVAQLLILSPYLPQLNRLPDEFTQTFGGFALVLALGLAWWKARRRGVVLGWDPMWRDFRDCFGTVWALRVQERINQVAPDHQLLLDWDGFVATQDAASEETTDARRSPKEPVHLPEELETAVRTSLRRFVSGRWIDDRLGRTPE